MQLNQGKIVLKMWEGTDKPSPEKQPKLEMYFTPEQALMVLVKALGGETVVEECDEDKIAISKFDGLVGLGSGWAVFEPMEPNRDDVDDMLELEKIAEWYCEATKQCSDKLKW